MRFLANENIPRASILRLRTAGHEVASVREDRPGSTDEEVLARGANEGWIILTFDRDYGTLIFHQSLLAPAGIIYFRYQGPAPEEPAEQVLRLIGTHTLERMFTTVDRKHVRQRPLPKVVN